MVETFGDLLTNLWSNIGNFAEEVISQVGCLFLPLLELQVELIDELLIQGPGMLDTICEVIQPRRGGVV